MTRAALAVMRIQPLHVGHCNTIDQMIRNFNTAILAIGSAQKSREKWDPWTFEERKQMVRNVYGDRVKIVQLNDLGTTEGSDDWADYVIAKIQKVGLPTPTDYYTGSEADARWYTGRFTIRESKDPKFYAVMPDGDWICRKLHIIERSESRCPAATEIRTFLELRSDGWKEWIPAVNWQLVEDNFPEEFKIKKVS